ncbi:MAG: MmoB/DmpM family protein [Actinomycetota bacterium]|jgi:phenol hydroxylase P2 protein|nr:MmoB/DmpM family protein [Actinomycetota bacterium]
MTAVASNRAVGLDLQETEENHRIVEAIQLDNPQLEIRHLPGLLKLSAPGSIEVRRESVEKLLGRPWETHEFQMVIVSYVGNITAWDDDHIVVRWEH